MQQSYCRRVYNIIYRNDGGYDEEDDDTNNNIIPSCLVTVLFFVVWFQTHGESMPFKCQFCRRLFKHKRSRDRHVKLHTGDKKYKCTQCDHAFSRRWVVPIYLSARRARAYYRCIILYYILCVPNVMTISYIILLYLSETCPYRPATT